MMRDGSDVQLLAENAALSLGVSFAAATRFGAGAVRHLEEARKPDAIAQALDAPEMIEDLAASVARAVEAASLGPDPVEVETGQDGLGLSILQALPCDVMIVLGGPKPKARLRLGEGSERPRAKLVDVPDALFKRLSQLAAGHDARGHGKQGAGLMKLD